MSYIKQRYFHSSFSEKEEKPLFRFFKYWSVQNRLLGAEKGDGLCAHNMNRWSFIQSQPQMCMLCNFLSFVSLSRSVIAFPFFYDDFCAGESYQSTTLKTIILSLSAAQLQSIQMQHKFFETVSVPQAWPIETLFISWRSSISTTNLLQSL